MRLRKQLGSLLTPGLHGIKKGIKSTMNDKRKYGTTVERLRRRWSTKHIGTKAGVGVGFINRFMWRNYTLWFLWQRKVTYRPSLCITERWVYIIGNPYNIIRELWFKRFPPN
jgi:hypothetical protein